MIALWFYSVHEGSRHSGALANSSRLNGWAVVVCTSIAAHIARKTRPAATLKLGYRTVGMDWLLVAVLLVFGAVCGAVMRLPIFVIALLAAAVIVLVASGSQGAGPAVLQAIVTVVILQVGYVAGIVLRSLARSLREQRTPPGKTVQRRAVQVPNEPKQR